MIYLDNAATSFPKPPSVAQSIGKFLYKSAGNPGRSGHALATAAQGMVRETRLLLASCFGAPDPDRIIFTLNATDALNLAFWGLLRPGDHVITTSMEHNSVIRPLQALAERGVAVTRLKCGIDGFMDLDDLERALRARPTRLVAMIHASNVCGTILPATEAAQLSHRYGALFLLDAAQSAGILPIDVVAMGIDLLAFPGHKGLLGPTGTGGLVIGKGVELSPLRQGGTGTRSEEEVQPAELPEGLEAGTPNTIGIAGLGAALQYLQERGINDIRAHEMELTGRLLAELGEIPGLTIHGSTDPNKRVAVISFSLEGWDPNELAAVLNSSFQIAVRAGLHCAPLAHRTLGTYPRGTVRLSPGCFTTEDDLNRVVEVLRKLAFPTRSC